METFGGLDSVCCSVLEEKRTNRPRRVVVLGSTGSIGTQTIDVVRRLGPEQAQMVGLAANRNVAALTEQARQTGAAYVAVADDTQFGELTEALRGTKVKPMGGAKALVDLASLPEADTVVVSVAGAAALQATLAACRLGKRVCIATKEVLVAAGELVMATARKHGAEILPVDSEHSAIFQCVQGLRPQDVSRLFLTASGGPFRTWDKERIERATLAEALNHPTWRMGGKITIDSATLMNKGLEVIEARWLFDISLGQIEVVVHPQSVVHSFVETSDGALLAQLGLPDMRLPIQIALVYPQKPDTGLARLRPQEMVNLTFEEPDFNKFPALNLARAAGERGGTAPAILNAANEAAANAFLSERVSFGDICRLVESALSGVEISPATDIDTVLHADQTARRYVENEIAGG